MTSPATRRAGAMPSAVLSRTEGYRGTPTGQDRPCRRGHCDGVRIAVRWPGGNVTWPCLKDMDEIRPGVAQLIHGRP